MSIPANRTLRSIREQFPLLSTQVNGKSLVYLDNAATTQKPQVVIDALVNYYQNYNSNIHRSAHTLAHKATEAFEQSREKIKNFINAKQSAEIIFTKGTTESVNLVAYAWGEKFISEGDEIIISALEHHSNLVPWQQLAIRKSAVLKVIPIDESGALQMSMYSKQLSSKTKLVAVNHISNALGTINPIAEIIARAHLFGAKVFIDGAQALAHTPVDVQALDADFYAGSAHKFYGPTGMGILYAKAELLDAMNPFLYGGEMIKEVSFEKTTFNTIPYKFEAGTPNIADAIATGYAIDFIQSVGWERIMDQEEALLSYATSSLSAIEGLRIIGTAIEKAAVISFLVEGIHPFDMGVLLDQMGIAIRTGHHCCQPLMSTLGIDGTCRASFTLYNTAEEVNALSQGIRQVIKMMQ